MTGVLTAISQAFNKNLVLGSFAPAAVFMVLATIFLAPIFPEPIPVLGQLETLTTGWQAVDLLVMTIVVTLLLQNLNNAIIRLYEGYPWMDSLIGSIFVKLNTNKRDKDRELHQRLGAALRAPESNTYDDYMGLLLRYSELSVRLLQEYPYPVDRVFPTRLGNVVGAFESYPDREYGIDAVTLWPRLIAKIDATYAAAVDDSKIPFNFMINSAALSGILAFLILIFGLVHPARLASQSWLITWLLQVGGFFVLSYAFYRWSIPRAFSWGNMVKGAFDLYRRDLLEQLGYHQNPQRKEDERVLWDLISKQMLSGDYRGAPHVDYTDAMPVPPVQQDEPSIPLEVRRGVRPIAGSSELVVVVQLTNAGQTQRSVTTDGITGSRPKKHRARVYQPPPVARNIVITETVPAGFDFVWGSASLDGNAVEPLGGNPYSFRVDTLNPQDKIELRYRILPRPIPTSTPAQAQSNSTTG